MNKEQYFFSNHKYICFLTVAINAINDANIPKYALQISKRVYNQHQLLALLLLKEYLKYGYRELIEIIELRECKHITRSLFILKNKIKLWKLMQYSKISLKNYLLI